MLETLQKWTLYELNPTLSKEETLMDLEEVLFFQYSLKYRDLDVCSNDYIRVTTDKGTHTINQVMPDIWSIIKKEYITVPESDPSYAQQYEKFNKVLMRLENTYHKLFKQKLNKGFIDSILIHAIQVYKKEELMMTGSCDFSISKTFSNYRFNAALVETFENDQIITGVSFTIRKLTKNPYTLAEVGITEKLLNYFKTGSGLILVSGPTGSAKSSTLTSILNWYNKNQYKKVITIEDPIEFQWSGLQERCTFRQREIGKHCLSFDDGIRDAMRENGDIIIVWELRDKESIEMAIEAGSTWHLVIATVHVDSTTQVLDRLLGFFEWDKLPVIKTKLASSLRFVLNQRLVNYDENKYRVVYEWLDCLASGVQQLIKINNIVDIRKSMYDIESDGTKRHKTLNESLFEMICEGTLSYTQAEQEYSNEPKEFGERFTTYAASYKQHNKISQQQLQERMEFAERKYIARMKEKI